MSFSGCIKTSSDGVCARRYEDTCPQRAVTGAEYRVRKHGFDWDQTSAACLNSLTVEITSQLQRPFSRNSFTVSCSFLYGPCSACHYLSLFYFVTISYWENKLRVAWLVVADDSEIHSFHLKFLHWVLTSGNVTGGNISEKYFASMFRFCFLLCVYSFSVALHPS
jgi:hypothetical protein